MKVTLLVSPRNPAPASRSELRTMKSKFFRASFASALACSSCVSRAKPTSRRPPLEAPQLCGDVARTAQGDVHFALALLELGLRNRVGRIVCHGGAHDSAVGALEGSGRGIVHLGGREHVHAFHARGRRQRRTPRDEGYLRTACGQRSGDGVAHLSRRVVRDEPHGVDGFDRGACRYDKAFTGQVLFFSGVPAERSLPT